MVIFYIILALIVLLCADMAYAIWDYKHSIKNICKKNTKEKIMEVIARSDKMLEDDSLTVDEFDYYQGLKMYYSEALNEYELNEKKYDRGQDKQ